MDATYITKKKRRKKTHTQNNALEAQTIENENYVKCFWSRISKHYIYLNL